MVPIKHRLKVDFNDTDDTVTLELFTTATIAGQEVVNSKILELDDCSSLCGFLKEIVETQREQTCKEATSASIQHVAALAAHANKTKKGSDEPGLKRIQLKGNLSPKSNVSKN